MNNLGKILSQIDINDLLAGTGVQRRSLGSSALGAFGLFAAGVAVGAAASLLLAPKTGNELREELTTKMNSWRDDMNSKFQSVMNKGGRYNPPS